MEYFSSLVTKPDLEIILDEIDGRKKYPFKTRKGDEVRLPTFHDREHVSGKLIINLKSAKKLEHTGIKIELVGCIEHLQDKKNVSKFITLTRDLEPAGVITNEITTLPFKFTNVEKQYESYIGNNMQVRYYVSAIVDTKARVHNQEIEFGVINPQMEEIGTTDKIKLEVGIDDWLHLVFTVDRNKFHLKDCIEGSVRFKKVGIKLMTMELQIIKKETLNGTNPKTDSDVVARFEIMDGAPTRNETIPIRWFISPYELTPTYSNINNRMQVQYYINIVLIDVDERKYFKQHEITFLRVDKRYIVKK